MVIMNKAMFKMLGNLKEENHLKKSFFKKNVNILLKAREDFLNSFKSNQFPTESENTPYSTPRGSKFKAS